MIRVASAPRECLLRTLTPLAHPPSEAALRSLEAARGASEREEKDALAAAALAKRDMDALVEQFLREETVEKRQRDAVSEAAARCAALEAERDARIAEDAAAVKVRTRCARARGVSA